MTVPISNVPRRVVLAASGTGPYSFNFEILAATDIAVYEDDTLLTLTTDYTVTINTNGTGSVTLTSAATGSQIAIVGDRTIARATDFTTGGDLFASSLNEELDQQTIFNQQNAEGLARSLKVPVTDPVGTLTDLPPASVRANKYLAFDGSGNPLATAGTSETTPISSAMVPVVSGSTLSVARAAMGLGTMSTQNGNNVSITGGTITGITDLAVADGGTGRSTLTADNVLLGDGTNAVKFVAPGTTGNVLTSNGTSWESTPPAAGYSGVNKEVFTANGTFTIPTGITKVKVTVVGGGGGGANGSSGCTNVGGGGGGGGGAAIKWLSGLTPGNTLTVTRGAGGAAQASGNTSSVASGTQSITTISATGGSGTSGVAGAAGGSGSNGDLNIGGQGGTTGSASSQETGAGGSSILGGGGSGSYATANGVAGSSYGGGGGGGQGGTGGAGANGVIIFEW